MESLTYHDLRDKTDEGLITLYNRMAGAIVSLEFVRDERGAAR